MGTFKRIKTCFLHCVVVAFLLLAITGCPLMTATNVSFVGTPRNGPAPLAVNFVGDADIGCPQEQGEAKFRDPSLPEADPPRGLLPLLFFLAPPTVVQWNWTFGDGATGTGKEVSHTYTTGGCHTVTLEVVLSNGSKASHSEPNYICLGAGNGLPTAVARLDTAPVYIGAAAQLNGEDSSDPEGDPLTYAWSILSAPAGSQVTTANLSDPTAVAPTFTPDARGSYQVQLIVDDGQPTKAPSAPAILDVDTTNRPPVAVAVLAPGQNIIFVGEAVQLDGRDSSDPDGPDNAILTYGWTFVVRPPGSNASIANPTTATPHFVPDVAGTYQVRLTVSDGLGDDTDFVLDPFGGQDLTTGNRPPVADAGPDQTVQLSPDEESEKQIVPRGTALVPLDGSNSSDPDGNPLTYQWSFVQIPSGSMSALSDAATVTPSFVADLVGTYDVQLVVDDGHPAKIASDPDTVRITVTPPTDNLPPMADAGEDQLVEYLPNETNAPVLLEGTGSSDPESDPLTYDWIFVSQPGGSAATLLNATSAAASFLPDASGDYVIQLVVDDGKPGKVASAPDTVTVTTNSPPVADAGDPQEVQVEETTVPSVYPDRLFSITCEGDLLYVICPETGMTRGRLPIRAFGEPGPYGAAGLAAHPLTGRLWTLLGVEMCQEMDKVEMDLQILVHIDPRTGEAEAVGTSGMNFAALAFGADGTLYASTQSPSKQGEAGNALYTLSTDDGSATLVGEFSPELEWTLGQGLALNPMDGLLYHGTRVFVEGPSFVAFESVNPGPFDVTNIGVDSEDLDVPTAFTYDPMITAFLAADEDSALFSLTPEGALSLIGYMSHTSAGLAYWPRPRYFAGPVTLDGSGSSDPDSDPITYAWTALSVPGGSAVTTGSLSDDTAVMPSFTPDLRGDYEWQLIVEDDVSVTRASAPSTVVVTYANSTPLADFHIRLMDEYGEGEGEGYYYYREGEGEGYPYKEGFDDEFFVYSMLEVDATPSYDPDGDFLQYIWTLDAPEASSINEAEFQSLNLMSPVVILTPDVTGIWTISLVVDDGQGEPNSLSDSVETTFLVFGE